MGKEEVFAAEKRMKMVLELQMMQKRQEERIKEEERATAMSEESKVENESDLEKSGAEKEDKIEIPEQMTREWWLKEGLKLLGKLRSGIN